MPTHKSVALARLLKDDLATRLSSFTVTEGSESNGNPFVLVGAGTAGSQSAYVQVASVASINKDVLGLAQSVFTPHVMQVVLEAQADVDGDVDVALLKEKTEVLVLGEVLKFGTKVELYLRANGTGPSASGITASNLVASWNPHAQYPLMADQ